MKGRDEDERDENQKHRECSDRWEAEEPTVGQDRTAPIRSPLPRLMPSSSAPVEAH